MVAAALPRIVGTCGQLRTIDASGPWGSTVHVKREISTSVLGLDGEQQRHVPCNPAPFPVRNPNTPIYVLDITRHFTFMPAILGEAGVASWPRQARLHQEVRDSSNRLQTTAQRVHLMAIADGTSLLLRLFRTSLGLLGAGRCAASEKRAMKIVPRPRNLLALQGQRLDWTREGTAANILLRMKVRRENISARR